MDLLCASILDVQEESSRPLPKMESLASASETSLACSHCGGVAIAATDIFFFEGIRDFCESCGMPGVVRAPIGDVYDDDGLPVLGTVYWESLEGDPYVTCEDPACRRCEQKVRAVSEPEIEETGTSWE